MKNLCRYPLIFALVLLCRAGISPASAQSLPDDAQRLCAVPPEIFASWFESGTPSLDGVVNPANSVNFTAGSNCGFYQWSAQMFLWLTSPAPANYGGGGGRIFESPTFFDVSPLVDGKQNFIRHVPGQFRVPLLRAAKVGPHKLPVIMDKRGKLFEIERPKLGPNGKPLILNEANKQIEVHKVTVEKGQAIFRDKAGKTIVKPKAIVRPELKNARVVRKFLSEAGLPIFVDSRNAVIETEEGQADGSVLLAQKGSLVYYLTTVNDVFAYFLTGTVTDGIKPKPTLFPTTQGDLDKITTFAAGYGVKFPDPNALAIEIKTAWVEVKEVSDPDSYITMEAMVPIYDTTSSTQWIEQDGQQKVTLALVGMHVVGSVAGHPEMVWSSFEHFGNAPNATYKYVDKDGNTKEGPQSGPGPWLFAAPNSPGPFNDVHAQINCVTDAPNDICAVTDDNPQTTISPSDTMRMAPFGAAPDVAPNAGVTSTAASNSEVIGLNYSVLGQLKSLGNDVRANYYMIGSTWTNGFMPTGPFSGPTPAPGPSNSPTAGPSSSPTPTPVPGNEVGTSQLANTTMETYQQIQSPNPVWFPGVNCFSCHGPHQTPPNTTTPATADVVSHIFGTLQPLPSPPGKTKAAPKKP